MTKKTNHHDSLPPVPVRMIEEHANWLQQRNEVGFDLHEKDFSEAPIMRWFAKRREENRQKADEDGDRKSIAGKRAAKTRSQRIQARKQSQQ